ncbi:hypothetical protein BS17DRAFT_782629 [Gyrodon lividus]|nr:hypothetical protein BS17DRAFT_782629 [Gyrodon lividus]
MGQWVFHRVQAAISGVAHGIYPSYRAAAAAQQRHKKRLKPRHGWQELITMSS